MAKSYHEYSETFEDSIKKNYSGPSFNTPDLAAYSDQYRQYKLDITEVYRPDKIAYELYNNINLSWVLNEINHFTHPRQYTNGLIIYFVPEAILYSLGIM